MTDLPLLYQEYSIVFQEIPDEITLAFNIAGCPYRCPGCHSPALQDWSGTPLEDAFAPGGIVEKYLPYITCVCFMGGDANPRQILRLARTVPCKTAFYSGGSLIAKSIANTFDYVKLGSYVEDLGGLSSPTTNQIMYKQIDRVNHVWEDITYRFWNTRRNNG